MRKSITHPSLGKITLSQTRRSKRISLSIKPSGDIRLSFPYRVSLNSALEFLNSKQDWVLQTLRKFEERLKTTEIIAMPYSTHKHSLILNPCDCLVPKATIKEGAIKVEYPLYKNYADEDVQAIIKKGIEEAWRKEAKEILPARTKLLADELGFTFRNLTIRNAVSRWGSCSSKDDISLSLHLMRLPRHLIDYIIIHELCHTIHKNHSSEFYSLLDKCVLGKHKEFSKQLKMYHTRW